MLIKNASHSIDSCAGLIALKASKTYRGISPENKRWVDLEDVMQEGLLEAWRAEQHFDPSHNVKYSTYLFRGLDMAYSATYHIPFRQQKRVLNGLVEMDSPTATGKTFDLPSDGANQEQVQSAVSEFMAVCRAVDADAVAFLLQFVLDDGKFRGHIRRRDAAAVDQIRRACSRLGVSRETFQFIHVNAAAKKQVLNEMKNLASSQSDPSMVNILECGQCRTKFSMADVKAGLYVITSLLCSDCLKKMKDSDADLTCFGKRKEVINNRTVIEGFSEDDVECRLHCRDRVACKIYSERGKSMSKSAVDELEDVDFGDIDVDEDVQQELDDVDERPAKSKSSKKDAKAAKSKKQSKAKPEKAAKAKPEKAAKAKPEKAAKTAAKSAKKEAKTKSTRKSKSTAKIDPKAAKDRIQLDEEGRDLPFKASSMMRYALVQALKPGGADEKSLEKFVVGKGFNWKFQRAVLLSGKSGDSSLRPYPSTHTWKVEQKDGRIRVWDVKRVAFYEKMARIDGR